MESKMAFQPIPNCVQVTLNATVTDVPVVNRWYVDVGHEVVPADFDAVFTVFNDWLSGSLSAIQTTSIKYDTIVVKDVDHEFGAEQIYTPSVAQGQRGVVNAPNSTAVVVSLRTALSGKAYRGRTYVGGIANADITDPTHLAAISAASMATVFQDLIDALNTATLTLVVVSKFLNGVKRATAVVTEIITLIVNTRLDNQRRRTAN
jgi:hypothetical protein